MPSKSNQMKYACIFALLLFSCSKNPSIQEEPFTFIGTWDYVEKGYQFVDSPKQLTTPGEGCNPMIQFVFTEEEFSLKLFQNQLCTEKAEVVLSYAINQENDSVYRFSSDRLLRSNFQPTEFHNLSDLPVIGGEVELIRRSENEFVTYLPLPEVPQINGREYTAVFIRYELGN